MAKSLHFQTMMTIFVFLTIVNYTIASVSLEIFRLMQFSEKSENYGSQQTSLNMIASHINGDILRKLIFANYDELVLDYLRTILIKKINGLLIILPKDISFVSPKWLQLQTLLTNTSINLPVYFTYESKISDDIHSMLQIQAKVSGSMPKTFIQRMLFQFSGYEEYQISMSVEDSKPVHSLILNTYYKHLKADSNTELGDKKMIVLTAYLDVLTIIPELSNGINSNGSGFIALLEIYKLLSKFIKNLKSIISRDILFIITTSSSLDFGGLITLLEGESIAKNIDFALCLDSIGTSKNLNLIFPKQTEEDSAFERKVLNVINNVSTETGLNIQINRENTGDSSSFEHEVFIKKSILSASLTEKPKTARMNFTKFSIDDKKLNLEELENNIKAICDIVGNLITDSSVPKYSLFSSMKDILDTKLMDNIISYMNKNPRFPTSLNKGTKTMKDFEQLMNETMDGISIKEYKETRKLFYTNPPTKALIYKQKSKLYDLVQLIGIISYLIILFYQLQRCIAIDKIKTS